RSQAFSLQPRMTARWEFLPGMTAKAAYGLYEKLPEPQYMFEGFGNPNLGPERAQHFIAGYEHAFTELINLDLQLFYNKRDRLRAPSDRTVLRDGRAFPEIWN